MTEFYLGIDVGGTDVKLGLVDHTGTIHFRDRKSTPELGTPENVFRYAIEFARSTLSLDSDTPKGSLQACGLAVPGVLDSQEFVLREVVNLPGWLGVPLKTQLHEISRLPSAVVNDANAAAFAEHSFRNLGGQSLALVTLGTGVGCGVVVGGKPCGGDHGCAGELGHITVDFSPSALPCTCGSKGHLECYAGASGVVQRAKKAIESSGEPNSDSEQITPKDIADLAEQGNQLYQNVIEDTADYIGRAIGLMGQVIDPEVVLLGGAMTFGGSETKTGRWFLDCVRQSVKQTTLVQVGENIKIEFAALGNDAGMIGAGMVAKSAR